jgi:broad specificity phosphatase PhoE
MQESKNIFVMRHAESLEDIDKTAYERLADENMPLSDLGVKQAEAFALSFGGLLPEGSRLCIYTSSSTRVCQTAEIIDKSLSMRISIIRETDLRLRKQNWGDVTIHNRTEIERERYRIGMLRYKFPGGESGNELLERLTVFSQDLLARMENISVDNILIINHGFEMRVFLMAFLGWNEEYFETLAHPAHCELKRLQINSKTGPILMDSMRTYDSNTMANFVHRDKTIIV